MSIFPDQISDLMLLNNRVAKLKPSILPESFILAVFANINIEKTES